MQRQGLDSHLLLVSFRSQTVSGSPSSRSQIGVRPVLQEEAHLYLSFRSLLLQLRHKRHHLGLF